MSVLRKPPIDADLGTRIREYRERAGLSQRQLVAGEDFSAAFVSRIESGERRPSEAVLRAIGRKLGVDPHELVAGVGDPRVRALREAQLVVRAWREPLYDLGEAMVGLEAALSRVEFEPWERP